VVDAVACVGSVVVTAHESEDRATHGLGLWDLDTGSPQGTLVEGVPGRALVLRPVPAAGGEPLVACAGWDGVVWVWDVRSPEPVRAFTMPPADLPADIISVTYEPGKEPLGPEPEGVRDLCFPGPDLMVTAGDGGYVLAWDVARGRPGTRARRLRTSVTAVAAVRARPGPLRRARPFAVTTTGREVQMWDLSRERRSLRFRAHAGDAEEVEALACAPLADGRAVALLGDTAGGLRLRAMPSGRSLRHVPDAHQGGVLSLAAAPGPGGRALALTGGSDGRLKVWDVAALVAGADDDPLSTVLVGAAVKGMALGPDRTVVLALASGLTAVRYRLPDAGQPRFRVEAP
jgi:WD40 repeat protein